MNRAPAALALATLSFASRTIAAEPCSPRAELSGDPAAVVRVADELARLGVTQGAVRSGCRSLRARVQLDERGAIAVSIVEDGRSEGRVVSDAALAAAWIDSWLRDELDGAWRPPGPRTTVELAAPLAAPPPAVSAARVRLVEASAPAAGPQHSLLDRGSLAVDYEQAFTGEAASWTGGSAAGCAALGRVCLGARVRYGHQISMPAAPGAPTDERSELAALATAGIGFELGRMAIVPELGLGVGRLAAQRTALCRKNVNPKCPGDPVDPSCAPPCIDASGNPATGPVSRAVASYQPRAAAALRFAVPLFDHVWLDAIASVSYVPFAHAEPFVVDPKAFPQSADPAFYTLPGEPVATMQLGVGLRVGMP